MRRWIGTNGHALGDRKGVTSLEYALIAAGVSTVIAACYKVYFNEMASMLVAIAFP